jgi:hypothetical protein
MLVVGGAAQVDRYPPWPGQDVAEAGGGTAAFALTGAGRRWASSRRPTWRMPSWTEIRIPGPLLTRRFITGPRQFNWKCRCASVAARCIVIARTRDMTRPWERPGRTFGLIDLAVAMQRHGHGLAASSLRFC